MGRRYRIKIYGRKTVYAIRDKRGRFKDIISHPRRRRGSRRRR